jgi:hypothetical protein
VLLQSSTPNPRSHTTLVVYRDHEVLMWAHDAGMDYVWVSRQLPGSVVEAFRESLGDALRAER